MRERKMDSSKEVEFKVWNGPKASAFVTEPRDGALGEDWGDLDGAYDTNEADTEAGSVCDDDEMESVASYEDLESLPDVSIGVQTEDDI